MPETARDIITLAMKEAGVLGVGQTLLAEDINDGFTILKRMMAQWQRKRWLVPWLTTINALGNNQVSNTIGPGGYFNYSVRPSEIASAYFIQTNTGATPVSMPLRRITSRENYDQLVLKDLNSFPTGFFYDNSFANGLGNLFIWPIPSPTYRIYVSIAGALGFPTDVDSVFEMPAEYSEAIHYNVAMRYCSAYKIPVTEDTRRLAKSSLNTVKVANVQVPTMVMPAALQGTNRGFNIYNPDNP